MNKTLYYLAIAIAFFVSIVLLWALWLGEPDRYVRLPLLSVDPLENNELYHARLQLLSENPDLVRAMARGGSFGGSFSLAVASDIFGSSNAAVADVAAKKEIITITEGVWHIRFPIVNAVLIETRVGLVLIDSGYAAASTILLQAIRELSDKPLHTVIYTHGHVDHAYGLKALIADGERPEIIAHRNLASRFDRYVRLRGSLAHYMSQKLASLPKNKEDLIYPTKEFDDRLVLLIGGIEFVLQHHKGETDDQIYVWIPELKVLASADYYQGFLPNAGNGKRIQRYPEQWAVGLHEMAALGAVHLLPGHGSAIIDNAQKIKEELTMLGDALDYIVKVTIDGLNAAKRKDQIFHSVALPINLRRHQTLREQYVSAQDISKMVIQQYTGWWNGIPSDWSPAPLEIQALEIASLAGGVEILARRAESLMTKDIQLASHLVDWARLAEADNPEVARAVLAVYKKRITHKDTNTMELTNYLQAMVEAKAYLIRNQPPPLLN